MHKKTDKNKIKGFKIKFGDKMLEFKVLLSLLILGRWISSI